MPKTTIGYGYAPDAVAEQATVMKPAGYAPSGTAKTILFAHGVTGSSVDVLQPTTGLNAHIAALVAAGYVVISADWGGGQNWSGPAAMAKFNWLVALAQNTSGSIGTHQPVGARTGKVGLFGGSMGGLVCLNLYKQFASQVAGALLWNPVTDLRWADAEGGYTPAYATGGLVGSWSGGITAAYPPASTYATGSVTLSTSAQTVNVVSTASFTSTGTVTIAGTTVTYTGKTSTSFTGCTIASGTLAVANNYLVTQGTPAYANSTGYRVVDEYGTWAGKTIKVIHASDDAVVPNQASQAFVTGVNSPGVTFRTPQPTGGHLNSFLSIPTSETVAFFNGLAW